MALAGEDRIVLSEPDRVWSSHLELMWALSPVTPALPDVAH